MNPSGIITAMVTPFSAAGTIDDSATRKLINYLIDGGVQGLFVLGTNGEFHVLSDDEKVQFAALVVGETAGRVPVYAGSGGNSTEAVISLSKRMIEAGVDALSVITPYFVSLSDYELYEHYTRIASEVTVPIMLYNIPKLTGNPLHPDVVARLAKHENIIGVKDSSGSLDNIQAYIEATKGTAFTVLSGSDSLILPALKIGAAGAIAATANVLTKTDVGIYQAFQAGDLETAQELQNSIEEFRRILKLGTIPAVLKYATSFMGIDVGSPRLPVQPITNKRAIQDIEAVVAAYKKVEEA